MRKPYADKVNFVDHFGGKVHILYGGGDCVTIMQEGAKGPITVGKDRAVLIAKDILKKLDTPVETPESVKQGALPF